jgi:preprotein translocase subunit SecE
VQWPTVPELQSSTITVLVASLLIAFVIFIMDLTSSKVMEILYGIFN